MRYWITFILCLLPFYVTAQRESRLEQYVETLKKDVRLKHTAWSVLIREVNAGKTLVSYNTEAALMPASTMKLLTTGAGLLLLGGDYRYYTHLYYDGAISDSTLFGNLYIVGGGDPTLGALDFPMTPIDTTFSRWTKAIKELGVHTILGKLMADESFFAYEIPESWSWGNMGNGYGTSPGGLMFCENMYHVTLSSGSRIGTAAKVENIYPHIPGAVIDNRITTGAVNSGDNTIIYNAPFSERHVMTGTIPALQDSFVVKGANREAPLTCAWYFNQYLNAHNIRTSGNLDIVAANTIEQERWKYITSTASEVTLSDIVAVTNKRSHNLYAETILKTIGVERMNKSDYESSIAAVMQMFDSLKIYRNAIMLADGSGLSRKNLITAKFMCDFLDKMYLSPVFDIFYQSLAVPGEEGTMRNMMKGISNASRIHAKTGSIDGVRAYAGYVENNGRKYCFSISFNNFNYRGALLVPYVERLRQLKLLKEIEKQYFRPLFST